MPPAQYPVEIIGPGATGAIDEGSSIRIFVSGVLTAPDAAEHAVPHGLGKVPDFVMVSSYGGFAAGQSQSTPADATNVYVTCSSDTGSKYQILALAVV